MVAVMHHINTSVGRRDAWQTLTFTAPAQSTVGVQLHHDLRLQGLDCIIMMHACTRLEVVGSPLECKVSPV
jgi:hypothetical protein